MSTSKNAKLQFESGQSFVGYTNMADYGDHQIYSLGTMWSMKSGYEASVRPNGIVTGRNMVSTHVTNDTVTIAAFTAYSAGTLYEVTAATDTITRPAGAFSKINSITMDSAGAIAVIAGTDSAGAAFSETRAAAGGPPLIPVDSVEIAQVRTTLQAAGVILSTEIFQVVGTHAERFDYPIWEENPIGKGDQADTTAEKYSHIKFAEAHDPIHTGPAYKKIYVSYYTPVFATVSKALNFKPAENTHSVTSTQFYDGVAGASSKSLGQGGFTALMTDNITDSLVSNKDEFLTFKFFPDKNKAPYILTQGTLGLGRIFPVDNQNQATATISAEEVSADFSS